MTETPEPIDAELTDDSSPLEDDAAPLESGADGRTANAVERTNVQRYLVWGALGVCALLAVFALSQFYGSVSDAIDLWVDSQHQPLMRAAFNFAVLLLALAAISRLLRELR